MSDEITDIEQPIEYIPVQVIAAKGDSVVIEVEGPQRYYVPKSTVMNGHVTADVIANGIEYGVHWEDYLDLSDITVDVLASRLRRNGIWTLDDLKQRDRKLLNLATNLIGKAVQQAAKRAEQRKPLRRNNAE